MKKIIIILFILSLVIIINKKDAEILIPNEAIRFRVIANSNNSQDINKKMIIKNEIEKKVYGLISKDKTVGDVKKTINNNMDEIKELLNTYKIKYDINYGLNYFPVKNYKGVLYPAGEYESLVITLGEGLGDNFWCVLFPPLCMLDNEAKDVSEIKYQFYVKKLIDKF